MRSLLLKMIRESEQLRLNMKAVEEMSIPAPKEV